MVAGSMREAFGAQDRVRYSGMVEIDGLPTRASLRERRQASSRKEASQRPDARREDGATGGGGGGGEGGGGDDIRRQAGERTAQFALASASLRQALQDMPELTEVSKHMMIEETQQGPQHRDRGPGWRVRCFRKAPRSRSSAPGAWCRGSPVRLKAPAVAGSRSTGHTAATQRAGKPAGYGPWELSADRANADPPDPAERGGRAERGAHFYMVAGRADTQPLFPDDPTSGRQPAGDHYA